MRPFTLCSDFATFARISQQWFCTPGVSLLCLSLVADFRHCIVHWFLTVQSSAAPPKDSIDESRNRAEIVPVDGNTSDRGSAQPLLGSRWYLRPECKDFFCRKAENCCFLRWRSGHGHLHQRRWDKDMFARNTRFDWRLCLCSRGRLRLFRLRFFPAKLRQARGAVIWAGGCKRVAFIRSSASAFSEWSQLNTKLLFLSERQPIAGSCSDFGIRLTQLLFESYIKSLQIGCPGPKVLAPLLQRLRSNTRWETERPNEGQWWPPADAFPGVTRSLWPKACTFRNIRSKVCTFRKIFKICFGLAEVFLFLHITVQNRGASKHRIAGLIQSDLI